MPDEKVVDNDPVFPLEPFRQLHFGFAGSFSLDNPKPVRNAMHMDVNGYCGYTKPKRQDYVRGLATDTGQTEQFLKRVRRPALEAFKNPATNAPDVAGFLPIEARFFQKPLKLRHCEVGDCPRRPGATEQSPGSFEGLFIARTLTDHA
jgi:hypothetical protein